MRTSNIRLRIATIGATVALMAIPLAAYANNVFNDVDDASVHIDGITYMSTSGVSVGCDASGNYCPSDNVTRAQMGTFMYRLSGNDPATAPSVNADQVDGLDANELTSGVAFSVETNSASLTGGVEVIGEATINAPTDGFAIVMGSATSWAVHSNGTGDLAKFTISASATAQDDDQLDGFFQIPDNAPTGWYRSAWAEQRVYPVSAGESTFYAIAEELSGDVAYDDVTLTVLFVPTSLGDVATFGG